MSGHTPTLKIAPGDATHVFVDGIVKPINCGSAKLADFIVTAANSHATLLSRVEALEKRVRELEPAAECWDALAKCYRITCMGAAGLHPDSPHKKDGSGYAHATFNFWTIAVGREPEGATGDAQDFQGRDLFGEFVKIAINNAALKEQQT